MNAMNDEQRAELQWLRRRQETLQSEVAGLGEKIQEFSSRLNAVPEIQPLEIAALEIPPLGSNDPVVNSDCAGTEQSMAMPPFIPPVLSERAHRPEPSSAERVRNERAAVPPVMAAPLPARETFELKLGTYWLVRVGIVMLLTGMVFLGTYAYKNFIGKLGPGGKVALLYTAGTALLSFGGWLQRKREKESLRNYGQVLFAGGLALVYFTTYAAHYLEQLRVITNPVVDALLLLAWSAVTVWIADRRKSEVLALFAIALSYYTSAITQVGLFTLYSNLVLAAAAVFFLVRHRWVTLSFISVLATYGGFAFWRFHEGDLNWAARLPELWQANFFLAGYWLFFTAAVFLARGSSLANVNRALFASMNNGAFFGLTLWSMTPVAAGNFWKFALGFGTTLLATGALARRTLATEPAIKNAYVLQGLVLVTAGFIAYFTGLKLALLLAAESVVLTVLGHQQKNPFLQAGGWIAAALSVAWLAVAFKGAQGEIWLTAAIGGALLFNGWWERCQDPRGASSGVRPGSAYFVALAIGVCGFATWRTVSGPWVSVAWMIEALLFTAAFYALRVPELPLFSQALCIVAQGYWFFEFALRQGRPHWAIPVALVSGTLALSHWWQRQKRLIVMPDFRNLLQVVYGLALVAILFFWFQPKFAPAAWLGFLGVLAVGVTLYGVMTRAWALAVCAQIFLFISSFELFQQIGPIKPSWQIALVPLAAWLVLGFATTLWLARHDAREEIRRPLLQLSIFYRGVAFLMSLWWVYAYVPASNQFWTLSLAGLCLLVLSTWRENVEALLFSGAFLAFGFAAWFMTGLTNVAVFNWPNLLAILAVLVAQQIMRRTSRPELPRLAHGVAVAVAGLALWLFVTRRIVLESGGAHFFLTAAWAGLAFLFFAAGFLLRERMHRWMGLGILGCAVARVFLSDVWKLETIYRILSFMALGLVLLALGFIYNKYQEKIRQWL